MSRKRQVVVHASKYITEENIRDFYLFLTAGITRRSERTATEYARQVDRWPSELTPEAVEAEFSRRVNEGINIKGVSLTYNALNKFVDFLIRKYELKEADGSKRRNWLRGEVILPKQAARSSFAIPNSDQIEQIIRHACSEDARVAMVLMYGLGLRVSEAVGLKIGDVTDDTISVEKTKGSKPRMLAMTSGVRNIVIGYKLARVREGACLDDPFLMSNRRTGGVNIATVFRWCRRSAELAKEAGKLDFDIDRVHPHIFRHAFCTHMLDAGVGLKEVGQLMGHSNIATTAWYAHSSTEQQRRAMHSHPMNTGMSVTKDPNLD